MILYRGKGIMIILYFIVSLFAIGLINGFILEYFNSSPPSFPLFAGLVVVVAGLWTRFTARDYIINKNGEKEYLDLVNELFFVKMETWGLILPILGAIGIIWGVINPQIIYILNC